MRKAGRDAARACGAPVRHTARVTVAMAAERLHRLVVCGFPMRPTDCEHGLFPSLAVACRPKGVRKLPASAGLRISHVVGPGIGYQPVGGRRSRHGEDPIPMYVRLCNALTDRQVKQAAVMAGTTKPSSVSTPPAAAVLTAASASKPWGLCCAARTAQCRRCWARTECPSRLPAAPSGEDGHRERDSGGNPCCAIPR